jgi:neutral amino acid transport system permease protein
MVQVELLAISIVIGSIYALMSVGLTLTLSVLKLPNLAHAELITVGAYATAVLIDSYSSNVVVALSVGALMGMIVALLGELLVFRPLNSRRASLYILILASFALGLMIRFIIYIWAAEYNLLFVINLFPNKVLLSIDGFQITTLFVMVLPVTIAMIVGMHLLLNKTRLGKSMRAMHSNLALAKVSGIKTGRVTLITWAIVGAITGVGGGFWSFQTQVYPQMGFDVLLDIFAIVVLAGLTSFYGTLIASYIIAFSENLLVGFLYSTFGISPSYGPIIPFIVIIAVLLVRPSGLQGSSEGSGRQFLKNIFRTVGGK